MYDKYEMVLMNSWNIEQYGTSVGDDFDVQFLNNMRTLKYWRRFEVKMNQFKHIKWFL